MSTGRTTDDRDLDSRRHRELVERLERIEQRLDIIEQRTRHEAAGGPGLSARQAQRVEEGW